ncbi:MAG: hypothetical protein GX591_20410 [Planctomycetes bacterium]|nr:hypothetical protein [Planctomycetota bacterium]
MNDPIDKTLKHYYRRFTRDHARRRAELLEVLSGESTPTGRARVSVLGPVSKVAATLAAAAAIIGLVAWLPPGPVLAGEVFADVIEQVRLARSVAYRMTLTLPDRPARSASVRFAAPGREVTAFDDGDRQVSDYVGGRILYSHAGADPWALRLRYDPRFSDAPLGQTALAALLRLGPEAGRFVRCEPYGGREVSVFVARTASQTFTVRADRDDLRPVRIDIETADGATLVLSDFAWDEPMGAELFETAPPSGAALYEIDLGADESDASPESLLAAALDLLAEADGGRYPDALDRPSLQPLLDRLTPPQAVPIDLGTGLAVVAGAPSQPADDDVPALVRYVRAADRQRRIHRGLDVLMDWTGENLPWKYVGAGVRRGEARPVLWYRPAGATDYRVLLGDGRWRDAPPNEGS